jgi:3-dehydroquinate synthetase
MATRLSRFCGLLVPSEASRIQSLLGQIFPQLHSIPISKTLLDEIFQKIQQDKKKAGGKIHFVFLKGIGQPEIRLLSLTKLKRLTHDLCQLG